MHRQRSGYSVKGHDSVYSACSIRKNFRFQVVLHNYANSRYEYDNDYDGFAPYKQLLARLIAVLSLCWRKH